MGIADAATAQAAADAAAAAAAVAQADATAAQTDADQANNRLAAIASDDVLTPDEKPRTIMDRDIILAERAGIEAEADRYSITTEKVAYGQKVDALTAYLATLTAPVLWSNLTGDTSIVGATFTTKFADVYVARQALLNKIAAISNDLSNAAQLSATQAIADAAASQATADQAVSDAATAQAAADAAYAEAAQAIIDAATAQATADGKIVVFRQASMPVAEGVGDFWIDTDDGNSLWSWTGSAWESSQDTRIVQALADAAAAQTTAESKTATFLQATAPVADAVGDFWIDSDDGFKLYRWSGSAWESVRDNGAAYALLGLNADGTVQNNRVGSASLIAGAASEIIVYQPASLLRSANDVLVGFIEVPTLPAGTNAIRVTMTGDFKIEDTASEHVWVRLREVSAAQAAAFKADSGAVAGGYPTIPSSAATPMNSDKLEYVFNVWDNAMVSWIDAVPEGGQLYIITMDALSAVDVRWRFVQISIEIIKRTAIT